MGLITILFINKYNSKHRRSFNYTKNNGETAERNVKMTGQQTDDDSGGWWVNHMMMYKRKRMNDLVILRAYEKKVRSQLLNDQPFQKKKIINTSAPYYGK